MTQDVKDGTGHRELGTLERFHKKEQISAEVEHVLMGAEEIRIRREQFKNHREANHSLKSSPIGYQGPNFGNEPPSPHLLHLLR